MNTNCEDANVNGSLPRAAESIDQPTDSPEVKLYQVVVAANSGMSLNQDRPLLCMDDPTPAAEEMSLEQREQEILEALKQADWKTACEELGNVDFHISETVSDAYYDRRWQGIVMFFGMVLGEPIEEDLDDFYGSTAAIKAIDAATAPTELFLEESEIQFLDETDSELLNWQSDCEKPDFRRWMVKRARERLVEIQQAIAAAERIKATQPNI